ncbi:tetratricopeptide repeat protein [Reichenbachiella versicolor]|uniref:tetratricopeptide repeat protein n=1 Tax=Reichenbachiella versicolor TaxID=1821036 RepID=UPI000D6E84B8|nr:tetratricopeptide repeat protein [Reichenbachiella versicolor]
MPLKLSIFILASALVAQTKISPFEQLRSKADSINSAQQSIDLLDEYLNTNTRPRLPELAGYYYLISIQYYKSDELLKSLSYLLKTRELVLKHGNLKDLEYKISQLSAAINFQMSDFKQAQKEFESALAIAESQKDNSRIVNCLFNIGISQRNQGQNKASSETLFRCLEMAKDEHIHKMVSRSLNQLGRNSEEMGNLKLAYKLYIESGEVPGIEIEHITTSYVNAGFIDMTEGRYRKAIGLFLKTERLIDETYYDIYIPMLNNLGRCYYHLEQYDSALIYLDKALDLNFNPTRNALDLPQLKESFEYLKLVAKAKNDEHLLKNIGILERISESNKNLEKANADLMVQEHEKSLENDKLEQRYIAWMISTGVLLTLMFILGGIIYFSRKRKKNSYKAFLKEIDETLDGR